MRKLILILVLLLPLVAQAGIVNNSGSGSEDYLTIPFSLLDTVGNPVAIDTTASDGDWGVFIVYYPDGDSCYGHLFDIDPSAVSQVVLYNAAGTPENAHGRYAAQVSAIDGASPVPGVYTYTLTLRDSSLHMFTAYRGEFQVYETADFTTFADRLDETISTRTVVGHNFDPDNDDVAVVTSVTTVGTVNDLAADAIEAGDFDADAIDAQAFAANAITNAAVADDIDVDVHTWDGTAAATADNGWVTATGFAEPGDAMTLQGDSLNTLMTDVDGIKTETDGGDAAWATATGFAEPGDAMTLQGDSLNTLMGDVDDILDDVTGLNGDAMRGTDDAFLAADIPANFGDLAITETDGYVTVGTNNDKDDYTLTGTYDDNDALYTQMESDHGAGSWETSDGDTNTTTGITYAVEQAGVDVTSISGSEATANNLQTAFENAGDTVSTQSLSADIAALNNLSAADVDTEVDEAIENYKLDHLVLIAAANDEPADNSLIARLAATEGDWSEFNDENHSLEALRVRGDAAWTTSDGDTNQTTGITYAVEQAGVDVASISGSTDAADYLEAAFDGDSATYAPRLQLRQLELVANATNTSPFYAEATAGLADGMYLKGVTGHGLNAVGGTSGDGIHAQGGTNGDGIEALYNGTGKDFKATLDLDDVTATNAFETFFDTDSAAFWAHFADTADVVKAMQDRGFPHFDSDSISNMDDDSVTVRTHQWFAAAVAGAAGGGSSPWTADGVDSLYDWVTQWREGYTGDLFDTLIHALRVITHPDSLSSISDLMAAMDDSLFLRFATAVGVDKDSSQARVMEWFDAAKSGGGASADTAAILLMLVANNFLHFPMDMDSADVADSTLALLRWAEDAAAGVGLTADDVWDEAIDHSGLNITAREILSALAPWRAEVVDNSNNDYLTFATTSDLYDYGDNSFVGHTITFFEDDGTDGTAPYQHGDTVLAPQSRRITAFDDDLNDTSMITIDRPLYCNIAGEADSMVAPASLDFLIWKHYRMPDTNQAWAATGASVAGASTTDSIYVESSAGGYLSDIKVSMYKGADTITTYSDATGYAIFGLTAGDWTWSASDPPNTGDNGTHTAGTAADTATITELTISPPGDPQQCTFQLPLAGVPDSSMAYAICVFELVGIPEKGLVVDTSASFGLLRHTIRARANADGVVTQSLNKNSNIKIVNTGEFNSTSWKLKVSPASGSMADPKLEMTFKIPSDSTYYRPAGP